MTLVIIEAGTHANEFTPAMIEYAHDKEAEMAQNIMIYGKAGWPYTAKARSDFATAEYFDVKVSPEKLGEMLRYSKGVRKVPVIVEGEKVTVGYGGS